MPFKRLLITLVGLGVLIGLFTLFNLNQDQLKSPFFFTTQRSLPTWLVFFLVAAVSLIIPFLFGLVLEVRNLPKAWSSRRKRKTDREVEKEYAAAMEEMQNGEEEEALERFKSILSRTPEHLEALLAAGTLLRNMDSFPEAIDFHKRANRLRDGDPRTLSCLAADYEAAGDLQSAVAILGEMISRRPRQALKPYRRMRALWMGEPDWDKAWKVQQRIQDLEKGMDRGDESENFSLGIRYELALGRKRDSRLKEAEQMLRRLIKDAPAFGPAHLELGRILSQTGKDSDALKIWKQGFSETGSPVFLEAVQDLYLTAEEPMKAIGTIRELGREGNHSSLCRLFLGRLYERLEMVDQALEEFLALESEIPDSQIVLFHLARLLERRGKHQEAAARYSRLIDEWTYETPEYSCRRCDTGSREWRDRCESCGLWGSLTFPLQMSSSPDDPHISVAPIYSTG